MANEELQQETVGEDVPAAPEASENDTAPAEPKRAATSNWKKLLAAKKEAIAEAKAAKAEKEALAKELAELKAKKESEESEALEEDAVTEDDEAEDPTPYDPKDLRIFLLENPAFKENKEEIEKALEEFPGISFEKAAAYAKANAPKTSKSKRDYDLSRTTVPGKKTEDLTDEEAVESMTAEQYLAYTRKNKTAQGHNWVK